MRKDCKRWKKEMKHKEEREINKGEELKETRKKGKKGRKGERKEIWPSKKSEERKMRKNWKEKDKGGILQWLAQVCFLPLHLFLVVDYQFRFLQFEGFGRKEKERKGVKEGGKEEKGKKKWRGDYNCWFRFAFFNFVFSWLLIICFIFCSLKDWINVSFVCQKSSDCFFLFWNWE